MSSIRSFPLAYLLSLWGNGRGAGGEARGALTPSPSPALRERGELVSGLSIEPHGVEVLEG